MTNTTSFTTAAGRPRTRRRLGVLVGAVLCVTSLAAAPSALADSPHGGPLGGTGDLVGGTVSSLPNTLTHLVGVGAGSGGSSTCAKADDLTSTLSCVIQAVYNALYGGGQAKTTAATTASKAATAKAAKAKKAKARKRAKARRVHR